MKPFDLYTYTDIEIQTKVLGILKTERKTVDRTVALRTILSVIDLTALNGDDTGETITSLCNKALSFRNDLKDIPSVAAVCVYPPFVRCAKKNLSNTPIKVASVAGCFPSGQSPLFVKLSEIAYAIEEGADEIDMVISRGKFLEGKFEETGDEIRAVKQLCCDKTLKVILETGELNSVANIRKASEIAILSGADFIKTSTGKISRSATFEAAWVMMETIKDYYQKSGKKVGFKPSGGISELDDAIDYYILLKHLLGTEWIHQGLFRIGASRLADKIYNELNIK